VLRSAKVLCCCAVPRLLLLLPRLLLRRLLPRLLLLRRLLLLLRRLLLLLLLLLLLCRPELLQAGTFSQRARGSACAARRAEECPLHLLDRCLSLVSGALAAFRFSWDPEPLGHQCSLVHGSRSEQPIQETLLRPVLHAVRTT
jgi:hypothetical protein